VLLVRPQVRDPGLEPALADDRAALRGGQPAGQGLDPFAHELRVAPAEPPRQFPAYAFGFFVQAGMDHAGHGRFSLSRPRACGLRPGSVAEAMYHIV